MQSEAYHLSQWKIKNKLKKEIQSTAEKETDWEKFVFCVAF